MMVMDYVEPWWKTKKMEINFKSSIRFISIVVQQRVAYFDL